MPMGSCCFFWFFYLLGVLRSSLVSLIFALNLIGIHVISGENLCKCAMNFSNFIDLPVLSNM